MALFQLNAYSAPIGEFDTAVNFGAFGATFDIKDPIQITIEDDDGFLALDALAGTRVQIADDDQGQITNITYRTITIDVSGTPTPFDVAIVERNAVADYLIVPLDVANDKINQTPLPLGSYSADPEIQVTRPFSIDAA